MSASPRLLRTSLGVSIGWVGISMIGDGVPALLLPHRLLDAGGGDATALGMTTLAGIGLAAAIQPFAGRWSDRAGRSAVIGAGSAVATAGLLLLVLTPVAILGAILALLGASIAQAGYQPMLPDRLPARWRGRAGGLKSAFDVGGAMLGFVLLGALIGAGQPMLAAVAAAVVLIGGFALSGMLVGRGAHRPDLAERARGRRDGLLHVVAARFLFLLGIYVVGRFLLFFVAARFELSPAAAAADAAMALAVLALVTVAASLPAGWLADRIGRRTLMVGGGLVGGAGIALLPAAGTMVTVMAAGSLMAVGSAAFGSASWAMLADLSPAPRAGGLLGIANLGTAGAAAMAGAFGPIIDHGGFGLAFGLAAACCVAGAGLALTLVEGTSPPMAAMSTEGAS